MNIYKIENVQKPLRDIDEENKSVLIEELKTNVFNYIHGMLSFIGPSDTDPVTCIQEICTVDSRSEFQSLKVTKTVLIVDRSHFLACITELLKMVYDAKLAWTWKQMRVVLINHSGDEKSHLYDTKIIKLSRFRNITSKNNTKYVSFLDCMSSVI